MEFSVHGVWPTFILEFSYIWGPAVWVSYLLSLGPTQDKKKRLGVLLIFWWRIWKERSCRIFENYRWHPLVSMRQSCSLQFITEELLKPD
jgi:hypothetical protein